MGTTGAKVGAKESGPVGSVVVVGGAGSGGRSAVFGADS